MIDLDGDSLHVSPEMLTEDAIRQALATVRYPGYSRDIVSFGLLKGVHLNGNNVTVQLQLATRDPEVPRQIDTEARAALAKVDGIGEFKVDFDIKEPAASQSGADAIGKSVIPGVKNIVAVASGKGGVGKSTVAANLAVGLASSGASVGLCDCDLYGPSIGLMFGTDERPLATEDNEIIPIVCHGVKLISMGFLLSDASPVIVRGPMATRYTQQFLRQVLWGDLDYLLLDLPPGTGDIQLTIVQTVTVTGTLIVTTPQEVALIDARKAASMFAKVNVPILGIVENMSYFRCPDTGKRYDIFGSGGGESEAKRLGVPLLGQIPIDIATREGGDSGAPIALQSPEENEMSKVFADIAGKVVTAVES